MDRNGILWTFGRNFSEPERSGGFLYCHDAGRAWESFGDTLGTIGAADFDTSADGAITLANTRDGFRLQVSRGTSETWEPTEIS